MYKWDDFDTQVQCEEMGTFESLFQEEESEDVMDRCEVVSLNDISGTYDLEDDICEEADACWLWDRKFEPENVIKGRII